MGPCCPCFQSSLSWPRALLQSSFLLILSLLVLLALAHGAADIRPHHHGLKELERYRSTVYVDGINRKTTVVNVVGGSSSSENPKPLIEASPSSSSSEVPSSSVETVVRRELRGAPLPPSAPSKRQNAAPTSVSTNAVTSP
ncbi:hypothetical protein ACLOJK_001461 [Asimina triloba]